MFWRKLTWSCHCSCLYKFSKQKASRNLLGVILWFITLTLTKYVQNQNCVQFIIRNKFMGIIILRQILMFSANVEPHSLVASLTLMNIHHFSLQLSIIINYCKPLTSKTFTIQHVFYCFAHTGPWLTAFIAGATLMNEYASCAMLAFHEVLSSKIFTVIDYTIKKSQLMQYKQHLQEIFKLITKFDWLKQLVIIESSFYIHKLDNRYRCPKCWYF